MLEVNPAEEPRVQYLFAPSVPIPVDAASASLATATIGSEGPVFPVVVTR